MRDHSADKIAGRGKRNVCVTLLLQLEQATVRCEAVTSVGEIEPYIAKDEREKVDMGAEELMRYSAYCSPCECAPLACLRRSTCSPGVDPGEKALWPAGQLPWKSLGVFGSLSQLFVRWDGCSAPASEGP